MGLQSSPSILQQGELSACVSPISLPIFSTHFSPKRLLPMSVFTAYFCGTGSHRFDDANPNF
ncbi:hypothetical protein, partial [Methylobacterium oryzihabitans]